MPYFEAHKSGDKLLIYHKDAAIIEYSVEDGEVKKLIHTSSNKNNFYWLLFLQFYEALPILRIKKDGKKFLVDEFVQMENKTGLLTKTDLKKRLRSRGMTKNQIEAVFVDMETL